MTDTPKSKTAEEWWSYLYDKFRDGYDPVEVINRILAQGRREGAEAPAAEVQRWRNLMCNIVETFGVIKEIMDEQTGESK